MIDGLPPAYGTYKEIATRVLGLMGLKYDDAVFMQEKRSYTKNASFRERPVRIEPLANGVPIIRSGAHFGSYRTGLQFQEIRLYEVQPSADNSLKKPLKFATFAIEVEPDEGRAFMVVARSDAVRLDVYISRRNRQYSKATRVVDDTEPVLDSRIKEALLVNTITFLNNAEKLSAYKVKVRRGLILAGAPGNGKTMSCRWLARLCDDHGLSCEGFTNSDVVKAIRDDELPDLMNAANLVLFDDLDISFFANREGHRADQRSVCSVLSAMDGIRSYNMPVVRIFSTNENTVNLDRAFRRPGRIDRVIAFGPPSAAIRDEYVQKIWPEDIRKAIDVPVLIRETNGNSFAEMEEIKSLLVQHYLDVKVWDLNHAIREFKSREKETLAVKEKLKDASKSEALTE